MPMRTGSEPSTARSPPRPRLGLSLWGLAWAVFGLTAFSLAGRTGRAAACGVLLVRVLVDWWTGGLVDPTVVAHRIRRGAHRQPGREVPPYDPDRSRP